MNKYFCQPNTTGCCRIRGMTLLGICAGFLLGVVALGAFVLAVRSKDEALTQDLLDRITARDAGEYLNILYYRQQHLKKPTFVLPAIKKTKIPTQAEIETEKAKSAAADKSNEHFKEWEMQQALRANTMRDTVL